MILGCIIRLTEGEKFYLIHSSRLTKIFVSGDVFCLFLQATGGDLQAAAGKHQDSDKRFAKIAEKLPEYIIIEGLCAQIVFFGFLLVVAVFHYRGRRHFATLDPRTTCCEHLYTLYGTSTLILVRSVFRVVDSVQGNNGYLLRHEVFLYIFDAILMLTVMATMGVSHLRNIATMLKVRNCSGSTMESQSQIGNSGMKNNGSWYRSRV